MADLTAEQIAQLPLIRAKTFVADLQAVHVHQGLPGSPATVVTEAGQFRLSYRLSLLAAKAYTAYTEKTFTGPQRGRLGAILAGMAGAELSPSEADDEEAVADPLQALASNLAREAMGKLEGLIQKSVAKEYERRRGALVADAIRSLV